MLAYEMNPNYLYSQSSPTCVKVISLSDDDNKYFTLNGILAQVFVKLVSGESLDDLRRYIRELENAPAEDKINEFLSQFIADMSKLGFIKSK